MIERGESNRRGFYWVEYHLKKLSELGIFQRLRGHISMDSSLHSSTGRLTRELVTFITQILADVLGSNTLIADLF
jgi:hypothetical protein